MHHKKLTIQNWPHGFFRSVLFILTLSSLGLLAVNADAQSNIAQPLAKDPALEARVMDIAKDLRCLVCQNETIAGSHADLAIDLRNQIQDQLEAGKSKNEIMQYMVDRYGDFVLYKPPVKSSTLVLWLGPFLLLLLGMWTLWRFIKKQSQTKKVTVFSDQDLSQARAMLESKDYLKKDAE
jgi:cytochrome c-type biogenesis protein CcmH